MSSALETKIEPKTAQTETTTQPTKNNYQITSFSVSGIPRPQGSKRHIGNGHVIEQSKHLKTWRNTIAWTAKQHYPHQTPTTQPIKIHALFFMPKPQHPKHQTPTTRPDIDKLTRALLDALTGIAYKDDSQVIQIHATKLYETHTTQPGVHITITQANS